MPIYEFACQDCGHEFEKIQSFSDSSTPVCPNCQGVHVQRRMSAPAIHFKGSGWYITDSKSAAKGSATGPKPGSDEGKGESENKADGKSDAQSDIKGDTKGDTKSDGKSDAAESKSAAPKADKSEAGKRTSSPSPAPAKAD
jgi:putative FmdB family regulatory protein